MPCVQDASEYAFQFSLTISTFEAHSHEKEAPGVLLILGRPWGSSSLAGAQPPPRPAVTEKGCRALTQCREPTHSLAASSGMVASSGLRRMHSFSTFTARADLARGERPCETQRFCPGPNTEGFPEGLLVGHPLNKLFQLGPHRAGAGDGGNWSLELLGDWGVNCGQSK